MAKWCSNGVVNGVVDTLKWCSKNITNQQMKNKKEP